MAKKFAKAAGAPASQTVGDGGVELSLKERDAIRRTKQTLMGAVGEFKGFREKVAKIAPEIIGLFNTMKAAREAGTFSLADFARCYDPTVPSNPRTNKQQEAGYTVHPTYMALAYMQRAIAPKRAAGSQGVANTATWRFERVIRTLLTLPVEASEVWAMIKQEFGKDGVPMIDRSVKALQGRVAKVEPLIDLSGVIKEKKIHLSPAKVISMNVAPGADASGTAAMRGKLDTLRAGGGRRVRVAG